MVYMYLFLLLFSSLLIAADKNAAEVKVEEVRKQMEQKVTGLEKKIMDLLEQGKKTHQKDHDKIMNEIAKLREELSKINQKVGSVEQCNQKVIALEKEIANLEKNYNAKVTTNAATEGKIEEAHKKIAETEKRVIKLEKSRTEDQNARNTEMTEIRKDVSGVSDDVKHIANRVEGIENREKLAQEQIEQKVADIIKKEVEILEQKNTADYMNKLQESAATLKDSKDFWAKNWEKYQDRDAALKAERDAMMKIVSNSLKVGSVVFGIFATHWFYKVIKTALQKMMKKENIFASRNRMIGFSKRVTAALGLLVAGTASTELMFSAVRAFVFGNQIEQYLRKDLADSIDVYQDTVQLAKSQVSKVTSF